MRESILNGFLNTCPLSWITYSYVGLIYFDFSTVRKAFEFSIRSWLTSQPRTSKNISNIQCLHKNVECPLEVGSNRSLRVYKCLDLDISSEWDQNCAACMLSKMKTRTCLAYTQIWRLSIVARTLIRSHKCVRRSVYVELSNTIAHVWRTHYVMDQLFRSLGRWCHEFVCRKGDIVKNDVSFRFQAPPETPTSNQCRPFKIGAKRKRE